MGTLVRRDGVPLPVQIRKFPQDNIANHIRLPRQNIPFEGELAIRWWVITLPDL